MANSRKKTQTFVLFIVIALLLVFFGAISHNNFLGDALYAITTPFSRLGIAGLDSVRADFKTVISIKNLISENADLREENKKLLGEVTQYGDLAKENELLRSQLGVVSSDKLSLLSGEIVSFDPVNFSNFTLINKGLRDGVSVGMPVIMPGNIILGKIFEASQAHSSVMLISDKSNKVNTLSQRAQVSGVLNGLSGGSLLMDLIEKSASLEEGDLILTSGLDGVYPKNLIVGKVTKVIADEGGIFKQAHIKPAYAEFQSNLIFVVFNYLK